jgi:hypothetical protein
MPTTAIATTPPAPAPAVTIDRLLEDAWTVDCATRLHQPAWAAASAERLFADLARYGQQLQARWRQLDPDIARSLANEVLSVQLASLTIADDLRGEATWPVPDMYDRVGRLIHQEAVAVGDTAWGLD